MSEELCLTCHWPIRQEADGTWVHDGNWSELVDQIDDEEDADFVKHHPATDGTPQEWAIVKASQAGWG